MFKNLLFSQKALWIAVIITLASCKKGDLVAGSTTEEIPGKAVPGFGNGNLPIIATQQPANILFTNSAGYSVYNGGYGSALATIPGPGKNHWFYLMTDRGPNVDGYGGKVFPVPDFNPQIGVFKLEGGTLRKTGVISLKDENGNLITGRPNPDNLGGTGEIPYSVEGALLSYDPRGLDTEGLAVASDGSLWICDEYGPHLVHFDTAGKSLERISPFDNGTGGRLIPAVFAKRRANRGMEGLTLTPDGQWLVGMMQSPLDNPRTSAIRDSRTLRILFFNVKTGATRQYLYQTEKAGNLVSEIAAVNDQEFLILERDGIFPMPGISTFKRVYRIHTGGATDVSDPDNSAGGKMYDGKTIEQLLDGLSSAGITPVSKSLAVDLIEAFPGYAHDKPEGMTLIGGEILAISNDDDFGIVDDGAGSYVSKYLPFFGSANMIDKGEMHLIRLAGK